MRTEKVGERGREAVIQPDHRPANERLIQNVIAEVPEQAHLRRIVIAVHSRGEEAAELSIGRATEGTNRFLRFSAIGDHSRDHSFLTACTDDAIVGGLHGLPGARSTLDDGYFGGTRRAPSLRNFKFD